MAAAERTQDSGRSRGGRPRTIDWAKVARLARIGAPESEIVAALAIPEPLLRDAATKARLRKVVAAEAAKLRISLRRRIRGRSAGRGKGSPNVLALEARALLGWDRQRADENADSRLAEAIAGAEERLVQVLDTLAGKWRDQVAAGAPCPRCSTPCEVCGPER